MKRERSEPRISSGLTAVLGALLLAAAGGPVGATCITGNCNAPAQNYDIRYADDPVYCNQSTTGGIQEAINSCGTGAGSGSEGCVVVLPRGEVTVRTTIVVGPAKYGVTLRGHGSGLETSSGAHVAGTTLVWSPDAGCGASSAGPVLEVRSASFGRFEDFAIDGKLTATTGILYTAIDTGGPSQQNTFENLLIENIANNGGHGIALDISPITTDLQVSESTFRHIFTRKVDIGIRTQGTQTTGIWIEDSNITCRYRCLELLEGDAYVHHSFISGQGPTADADVWIGKNMNNVQLIGTVHESCSRAVIYTEDNVGSDDDRMHTTTMIGGRVQHFHPDPTNASKICDGNQGNTLCGSGPCHLIEHNQPGSFNLYSNEFKPYDIGGNQNLRPVVAFSKGDANTSQLRVSSIGNLYTSDVQWALVKPNEVFIASTDFLPGKAEMMSWQTRNIFAADPNNPLLPQEYPLVLQHDTSDIVAWVTQQGNLHFKKTTASVDFEGASNGNMIKVAPSSTINTTTTVTLPNRNGTAMVSGDTLTGDVIATLGAGGATTTAINGAVVGSSNLDVTNPPGTVNQCLTKAAGDQFTWASCDPGAAGETDVLTFTSAGATVNTLRYFAPNTGLNATTESGMQIYMPARTAKSLRCKLGTAPGASKTWTLSARSNGATVLSCAITGAATTCTATGSVLWTTGSLISLLMSPSNSPAAATVSCSLGIAP